MQEIKSILVGLDFDPETSQLTTGTLVAARQARWLAERTQARVDYLHSTHWNPESGEDRSAVDAEALKAAAQEVIQGGGGTFELDEKPVDGAVLQRVADKKYDLVVVAKRNRTKREDRRIGSVAIRLIRTCPAPVWVVRPDHPQTHRCIMAATDLSPVGDRAVEYGAFLAQAENCDLKVVHAWQRPMEMQLSAARMSKEEYEELVAEIEGKAAEEIRGVEGVAALGDRVEKVIRCAQPSTLILKAQEHFDPDLVVFGTVSREGIAGMLIGNTAERLLYQLDCSILTIKPEGFGQASGD